MLPPCLLLIVVVATMKVVKGDEDIKLTNNVTTLYPIANRPIKHYNNSTSGDTKNRLESTSWKIEAAFAESKVDEKERNGITNVERNEVEPQTVRNDIINNSDRNEVDEARNFKENTTNAEKAANSTKEFRPSPHLGDFIDSIGSVEVVPNYNSFDSFTPVARKPAAGFTSSPHDSRTTLKSVPKEIYYTHKEFPYKFESNGFVRSKDPWRSTEVLDSKPTAEVPVRVPAGGFYKSPDAFKHKPAMYGEDGDYGLQHHGNVKDSSLRERQNPWKSLLRLVTAFIPVGLIISALTPNVINVQNTGPANNYPANLYRRSDDGFANAPISEPCRRRLLCELHAERNYIKSPPPSYYGKQCYKIHCEDTNALYRMLRWLFTYSQGAGHQRGTHYT